MWLMAKMIPLKDRLAIYSVMAQYSKDGQSIVGMIKNKAERAKKKKIPNGDIFIELSKRVDELSLADSFKDFIPTDEYVFIRTAETRANLAGTLDSLVFIAQTKKEMSAKFRSIMMKPVMFMLISFLLCSVVFYALVPQIGDMADADFMSNVQIFLLETANPFIQIAFPVAVVVFLSLSVLFVATLPIFIGKPFRPFLDRVSPLHIVYRDFTASIMLVSLAANLKGGELINTFFSSLNKAGSRFEYSFSRVILSRLQEGNYSIAESLDIGFFNKSDIEQIYDYTSGGGDIVKALGAISSSALDRSVERSGSLLMKVAWIYMISFLVFIASYIGVAVSAATATFSTSNMMGF